ncbi:MAG TPA: PKD domain-containing protein, partial [Nakamurella sp.]
MTCSVDGGGSTDPDGSITSYSWSWGDGTTTTGATSSHTYPAAGSYPVTLTVTDDRGAPMTIAHTLTATAPANLPPTARSVIKCTGLTCAANSVGSADPDGTLAGFVWNWGDGSGTSSGATSQHSYAGAGTYPVGL